MIRLHTQLPDWHMPGELSGDNRTNALFALNPWYPGLKNKIIVVLLHL
jgi:hypothetical protein